ncbi:hypothetical protein [Kitasatospora griseola]|uniref:hypothetical protein n=1 Tax=Kitasatospora griseola TaxID=2064 RepID=UPI0019C6685C|nr:hypothetical protein [Kitasatospora griseola]GGR08244.1 hypothetical protein GCM10010195_73860 [Kitasatospora griseola]
MAHLLPVLPQLVGRRAVRPVAPGPAAVAAQAHFVALVGVGPAGSAPAARRAKELGADQALEALRAELEPRPRLGRLIRTVVEGGQRIELYSTRIEDDAAAGRPAVNVVHAFAPAPPWPPTVRIAAVVPEDLPHPDL